MVTPMRVIDALSAYLYSRRGVRVFGSDGLVHRLFDYRDSMTRKTGWVACCGYVYGDAGERLETFDPITCVACASDR